MQQSTIAVSTVPAQTAQIVTSALPQSTLNVPVIRGLGMLFTGFFQMIKFCVHDKKW